MTPRERVTGIGGIFFKSPDPRALQQWYQEHLGVPADADGYVAFAWRELHDPERTGLTTWSAFAESTTYFAQSRREFMVNYRVESLDRMLAQLRAAGVAVDDATEDTPYGRFGWATDPDGTRIELWEPPVARPPAAGGTSEGDASGA